MIDDPHRLTLEAIVDDTATNSDVSVSMGLIVTELVINAIKHAFPDQTTGGKITVSFAEGDGAWLLSVKDNGTGMSVDKHRAKPGLGTGIVNALSKQLEARVTVLDANPGTRVEVRARPKLSRQSARRSASLIPLRHFQLRRTTLAPTRR